jgi:tyrosinase
MSDGIVVRPDAQFANVAALEDAYQKMQALSASDNRGWIYWAEYHGYNRYECWHHARVGPNQFPYDLFLPWHRAYLTFFDNAARDQNPAAVVPWWDWTSPSSHQTGLPAAYTSGGPALESGSMPPIDGQPARRTTRNPSDPGGLPTPEDVDRVLNLSDFRDFSNQLQDIHDSVHIWTGGDMGSIATAAFDPVFWAHHAMIDRLWYMWQVRHGVNNIPSDYLGLALFPSFTVQQVLDVRALGYDYATAAVAAGTDVPAAIGATDATATPPAGPADGGPQANTPPTPAPAYTSPAVKVGALDPSAGRIDIEFHNVAHGGASYEGRVYLNNPEADATTGYNDPSYAGSYHIFGHGGCLGDPGHCDVEPRRNYDPRPAHPLTPARKVVIANDQGKKAIQQSDEVTVTVVPLVEPLPYENVDPKYTEDPVDIGYVQIVGYR